MTDHHGRRIVAVVVTFNRLELLRRQLRRLQELDELDEVLVVDNGSTDGTGAWLACQAVGGAPPETNTGAAGAPSRGLRRAVDGGAALVWPTDDAGPPEPDSPALLLGRD